MWNRQIWIELDFVGSTNSILNIMTLISCFFYIILEIEFWKS